MKYEEKLRIVPVWEKAKIIVRCKNCGWRIFDKVTMTTGVIELKCPNCHRVVEVDLSLRKGTVKYRLTRSSNRANN